MKRSGPRKVDTITHAESGLVIDVFLDGTRFTCTVLEETLTAPDATILRADVLDKIEHWLHLTWFPVIRVEVKDTTSHYSYSRRGKDDVSEEGLSVGFNRYYLTRTPAGKVWQCDWSTDEIHRKAKMKHFDQRDLRLSKLPLVAPLNLNNKDDDENDVDVLVDYTPQLWENLVSIRKSVAALRKELTALVSTRKGVAKMLAHQKDGVKLLT